ncbi:MAG: hypothetical protein JSW64_04095 [Candidatus Zixiibacteriota bacterium]|nr:MAG: hypothetical protein JSW64_04095 [candidate division Zixibacteria bacterium]
MSIWEKAKTIDRRIIFLFMFLGVALPLLIRIGLPVSVTNDVKKVYDYIEGLEPGSIVLVSYDHDTGTLPEMLPMSDAILRHLFRNNIKVIGMALRAEGTGIGRQNIRRSGAEFGKIEGEDFVFLGFRPEITAAILGLGTSFERVFPKDDEGIPIRELPMMKDINNYGDIEMVISITDDDTPVYWVNYANARFKVKVVAGLTAVMATTFFPFIDSGQMVGMVAGLKGAAEYEKLIEKRGRAGRGMDAQSIAHLVMIGFIIIGNIAFIMRKRGK